MKKFLFIAVAALLIATVLPGATCSSRPGNAGAAADTLVVDAGLLKALDGKTVEEASKVKLDAVTGATYSSKAIIENIQRGLDSLKK